MRGWSCRGDGWAHLCCALVAQHPGEVGFLCVIEPKTEPPEQAERAASAKMITSQGANLCGVACVIEGDGFRAAITRSVLSSILLMIRGPVPIQLFETSRLAEPWLMRRLGSAQSFELEQGVERARTLLGKL